MGTLVETGCQRSEVGGTDHAVPTGLRRVSEVLCFPLIVLFCNLTESRTQLTSQMSDLWYNYQEFAK